MNCGKKETPVCTQKSEGIPKTCQLSIVSKRYAQVNVKREMSYHTPEYIFSGYQSDKINLNFRCFINFKFHYNCCVNPIG